MHPNQSSKGNLPSKSDWYSSTNNRFYKEGKKLSKNSRDVDLVLKEYEFLRQEIMAKMDASWKILTFETGGTSLILGFVFVYDRVELLPLVPFLILVTSFMHFGETQSVISLGNYIHDYIEKDLKALQTEELKSLRWECFAKKNRGPYNTIHISTIVLFMGLLYATLGLMVLSMDEIMASFPDYRWLFYGAVVMFAVFGVVYVLAWLKYNFFYKPKSETCKEAHRST